MAPRGPPFSRSVATASPVGAEPARTAKSHSAVGPGRATRDTGAHEPSTHRASGDAVTQAPGPAARPATSVSVLLCSPLGDGFAGPGEAPQRGVGCSWPLCSREEGLESLWHVRGDTRPSVTGGGAQLPHPVLQTRGVTGGGAQLPPPRVAGLGDRPREQASFRPVTVCVEGPTTPSLSEGWLAPSSCQRDRCGSHNVSEGHALLQRKRRQNTSKESLGGNEGYARLPFDPEYTPGWLLTAASVAYVPSLGTESSISAVAPPSGVRWYPSRDGTLPFLLLPLRSAVARLWRRAVQSGILLEDQGHAWKEVANAGN